MIIKGSQGKPIFRKLLSHQKTRHTVIKKKNTIISKARVYRIKILSNRPVNINVEKDTVIEQINPELSNPRLRF